MALSFPTAPNPATLFVKGAGRFYLGTYAAAGADSPSLRDMGPTSGGIAIEYNNEKHAVECDQFLGAVAMFPSKETVTVKVTLQDATIANLYKAYGFSLNTLTLGDRTDNSGSSGLGEETATVYYQLVWKGEAPSQSSATARVWQFYKAVVEKVAEVKMEKGKETAVQFTFRCLTDPSVTTANKCGKVFDA